MLPRNNHIAVFSLAYHPFVGGAELAVKEIITRLKGYRFTCFTCRFENDWLKEEYVDKVYVVRLGRGRKATDKNPRRYYGTFAKIIYTIRAWRAAEQIHKETPVTLIWGVMAAYGGLAAMLFKLRHPKIPFLLTLQEGDSERHILRHVGIFYPLWKLIFKKADYIQAISNYLADFGRRHGAICPIEVVPNGVDLEKIKNLRRRRISLGLKKLKIKTTNQKEKDKKIIITTSRLVYKNGIDILIRAAAKLRTAIHNPKFIIQIIGGGREEKKLKKLAKDLGLSDKIEFLGQLEQSEIPKYLSYADIFVRASRSEGLGSSFLEAMAMGIPIIGTKVGGIPDFLKDRETGLFTKVENENDLAEKINLLLTDKNLREKIANRGCKLVLKNFSWDLISERMDKIFSIICKPRKQILITTGIFPPDIGGPATYSNLLFTNRDKLGSSIKILTYGIGNQKQKNKVYIVSYDWPKGVRHIIYLFKTLFIKSDVILAADSSFGASFIPTIAAKIKSKKLVVRVTGDYAWEQGTQRFGVTDLIDEFQKRKYNWRIKLLKWFQNFTVKNADIVITPSEYLKKIALGWGADEGKVKVVYNSVECENPLPKEEARKALNLNGRVIVSVGRLVPWKGFDVLIKAVADLIKQFPDFKLVIIGDGPELRDLQQTTNGLQLQKNIKFTGKLPKNELHKYLSAADCFVLNTAYEGFSHLIIEAMAKGLPVITTNVGGNPEAIENKVSGLLVEYNNKGAIKDALIKLMTDHELKKKISYNAKLKAQKFSTENMLTKIKNLLCGF